MKKTNMAIQSKSTRSFFFFILFAALCVVFLCTFFALGIWQVQRLGWKEDLIKHANERVQLSPVAAPPQKQWADVHFDTDEYRPIFITGTYLNEKEIHVSTIFQESSGYWVLTPLKADDGTITFINRGFVPMDKENIKTREDGNIHGETTVSGLLRMSEGNGIFPRNNNPDANIWYSRQLPEMAKKLGLTNVAPYFIDADKTPNKGGYPIGGLTTVTFRNNHLSYAITWFILTAGVLAALIFLIMTEIKHRKGITDV